MDDNLPLRKIALTCLETLLDTAPDRLDVAALLQVMPTVLADKDEVKAQAHQVRRRWTPFALLLVATLLISGYL